MSLNSSQLYRTYYGSNLTKRQKNDFYETPRDATEELLKRVQFSGVILEPACGKGAIVKVLREYYKPRMVVYGDLINYHLRGQRIQDFLTTNWTVANIITNSPYSLALPFIRHAVECAQEKVAMLFRLDFLQSRARKKVFHETRLTDVYVFSYRLKFIIDGKPRGMIPYAWFLWDKTSPIRNCDNQYRLHII